ncbi:MAG: choice-of-anchor Q domain-containing protein, partial [bacterium]
IRIGDAGGGASLERVQILNNDGIGILLSNSESLSFSLRDSRISGNQGTGISIGDDRSFVTIERSEISHNHNASGDGGGIWCDDSVASISNSTISGNSALRGGGLYLRQAGCQLEIRNASITKNSAAEGGGIQALQQPVTLINSVVAENIASVGPDCNLGFPANTLGGVLIGAGEGCQFTGSEPGVIAGTIAAPLSPQLDALVFNGGETRTQLPLPGSPLVDFEASGEGCLATDQRGVIRAQDGNGDGVATCDLGAVELADYDNDGLIDNQDPCPDLSDGSALDTDGDGSGDACDPFPADPLDQRTACELNFESCTGDLLVCDDERQSCSTDLDVAVGDLSQCRAEELTLLAALEDCQTGPPFVGDVNWDGSVDLLDSVLLRRQLARFPIEPPSPAVTSIRLRKGDEDRLEETLENGDIISLAATNQCPAIEVTLNESGTSLRYDWTPPGGIEQDAYFWENNEPFCWREDLGWLFFPEVPDCACTSEMTQLGEHTLVVTPCSVDVDFGAGETCAGNGGIEGPATSIRFTIAP